MSRVVQAIVRRGDLVAVLAGIVDLRRRSLAVDPFRNSDRISSSSRPPRANGPVFV